MGGLTINALYVGCGKWRIIEHLLISTLPLARRIEKIVFLPQPLPQGVHLQVLESVVVAQRASGAGQSQV